MPTPQELWLQQLFNQINPQQGLNFPQLGLGTALLGSTLLGRDEPGYVTEARQNVRNLSSPTGFASGFTNTVNALKPQFDPLIQQQQNRSLDEISQRYTAAFPGTVGAQPQEFGAYGTYMRDQFQPAVQNFYGQMGMQGLNTQYQAANTILQSARPDPFKEGLAALAGSLILGGMGNGGGNLGGFNLGSLLGGNQQGGLNIPGFGGNSNIGSLLSLIGSNSPGGSFPGGIEQALPPAIASQLVSGIQAAFPAGTFSAGYGGLEPLGNGLFAVTTTSGQAVGTFNPATGMITNATTGATAPLSQGGFFAPQAAGTTGLQGLFGGTGLLGRPGLGTLRGIGSGVGSAAAGFGAGNLIGQQLPDTRLGSTFAGAGGGAAAGFLMGGPIGAAIGAIAGAIGGFTGGRSADHQFKALRASADLQSAGTNEASIERFWVESIGAAGGDITPFMQAAQQYGPGQIEQIAAAGATQLMASINEGRRAAGLDPMASLNELGPEFREGYISWIMQHNRIEQGGRSVAVGDISQQAGLLAAAGWGQPNTSGILATGPGTTRGADLTQHFANPDQPQRAEMEALAQKMRAAGYTGPIPEKWYSDPPPGRIAVPIANGLIDSITKGATDPWYNAQNILQRHGLL